MMILLDVATANKFCQDLGDVIGLLKTLVKLLQWAIPIGLIIFGMLDLGKAVIAGKEDEMKKAQSTLIKRIIYAVAVFLVVTLVTFVMGLVGSNEWKDCWKNVGKMNAGEVETDPESGAA